MTAFHLSLSSVWRDRHRKSRVQYIRVSMVTGRVSRRKRKTLKRRSLRKTKQRRQRGGLIFSRASCRKALNKPTRYNSPYRLACQATYGDSHLRGHERLIDAFGNAEFRPKRKSTAFTVGDAPRSRAPPSSVNPLFLESHGLRSSPLAKRTYLSKKTYQVPGRIRKTSMLAPANLYKVR